MRTAGTSRQSALALTGIYQKERFCLKDFFKTSSFKVLAIAVVVLLGLIIYTATAGGSLLASLLGFVTSPMQSVSTQATGAVTEFVDLDALSRDELKSMIDSLTQENAQLRDQLVDYENTLQENEQLKVQLEITEEEPENTLRAATVIGRDPNDVFYGFSIDQGTLNGVEEGDPVITQNGLVGIVSQAYATTSKVTTLLSEDVKVSAVDSACGESGVIASDIASASSGLLRLEYLPSDTQAQVGDIITTSGAGSTYPADIIIGRVESVQKSESDISQYAVVRPYEDLTSVQEVFVIIDFPGAGEGEDYLAQADPEGTEDAE